MDHSLPPFNRNKNRTDGLNDLTYTKLHQICETFLIISAAEIVGVPQDLAGAAEPCVEPF
jgi:hypothetical protein